MTKLKSFVIHTDSLTVLDDLSDEQAGQLFRAIRAYHLDADFDCDTIVKVAFSPFKNQFIRDEQKYEAVVNRNRKNGKKGGRPVKTKTSEITQDNPKNPSGFSGNPEEPKKADSNSNSNSNSNSKRSMSTSPEVNQDVNQQAFELFTFWRDTMRKPASTKPVKKRLDKIKARLNEGYAVDDIKQAIVNCSNDPFSMGQNNRGKKFNDIELICRDAIKLDSFLEATNERGQQRKFREGPEDLQARVKRQLEEQFGGYEQGDGVLVENGEVVREPMEHTQGRETECGMGQPNFIGFDEGFDGHN